MPDPAPAPVKTAPVPAKPPAPSAAKAASVNGADDTTLREVYKDGERLLVHITAVAAHLAVGWLLAEAEHNV